jgi:hypothetical protein
LYVSALSYAIMFAKQDFIYLQPLVFYAVSFSIGSD